MPFCWFFYFFSHFQALERIKILFPYLRYLGGFSLVWQCMDYWHGIMVIQSRHKTNCYHRRVDSMAVVAASPSWLEGYVQEYNKIVTWRFLMPSKPIEWSTSPNEGRSSQFSRHELEKYRSRKVNLCTHKEFMKTEEKTWSQHCSFLICFEKGICINAISAFS